MCVCARGYVRGGVWRGGALLHINRVLLRIYGCLISDVSCHLSLLLQHTATLCNKLKFTHAEISCNTLEHTATHYVPHLPSFFRKYTFPTHCYTQPHAHCNTLLHTATHYVPHLPSSCPMDAFQYTATNTHWNTVRNSATRYTTLQHIMHLSCHLSLKNIHFPHTATHCDTHTATHCDTLQHTTTHHMTHLPSFPPMNHFPTHCNTLRHSATRCNTSHTSTAIF